MGVAVFSGGPSGSAGSGGPGASRDLRGTRDTRDTMVGASRIVAVHAEKTGQKWALKWCSKEDLPDPADPTVSADAPAPASSSSVDEDPLKASAKMLLNLHGFKVKGEGFAYLSIPDIAAKSTILDFDELPQNPEEAASVIRWKSARGLFLEPDECSVGFQSLTRDLGSSEGERVLSVCAPRETVGAYEDAVRQAGFAVPLVSIHSLNILNLFSTTLDGLTDFTFIVKFNGYFAVIFLKDGIPDFYRCKEVSGREDFISEVGHSFTFYFGKNPDADAGKVFILDAQGDSLDTPVETIEGIIGAEVEWVDGEALLRSVATPEHGQEWATLLEEGGAPLELLSALGALESGLV